MAFRGDLLGDGLGLRSAGFRTARRPILGRKGNTPELRAAGRKFQANFGFVAANGAEKGDNTLLLFLGHIVAQSDQAAAGDASLQKNEGAVGVDGESVGLFVETFALGIEAIQVNADLHEDTLAAATRAGVGRI